MKPQSPCCKWCEGPATIEAFDYGDGIGSWWCEKCRQLMKLGFSRPQESIKLKPGTALHARALKLFES